MNLPLWDDLPPEVESWAFHATEVVRALAEAGPWVQADDVWRELRLRGIAEPDDPRSLGWVMLACRNAGIVARDPAAARRGGVMAGHTGIQTRWRSMVYQP